MDLGCHGANEKCNASHDLHNYATLSIRFLRFVEELCHEFRYGYTDNYSSGTSCFELCILNILHGYSKLYCNLVTAECVKATS